MPKSCRFPARPGRDVAHRHFNAAVTNSAAAVSSSVCSLRLASARLVEAVFSWLVESYFSAVLSGYV